MLCKNYIIFYFVKLNPQANRLIFIKQYTLKMKIIPNLFTQAFNVAIPLIFHSASTLS